MSCLPAEDSARNSRRGSGPVVKNIKRYERNLITHTWQTSHLIYRSAKLKQFHGFAITHTAWSYFLDTVRAESIQNSGQSKSSFTKAHFSSQGPKRPSAVLLRCLAAWAGREQLLSSFP